MRRGIAVSVALVSVGMFSLAACGGGGTGKLASQSATTTTGGSSTVPNNAYVASRSAITPGDPWVAQAIGTRIKALVSDAIVDTNKSFRMRDECARLLLRVSQWHT